jgi:HSP20 family protein
MPFNFPGLMRGVASHPFFQHMSNAAYQYRNGMHPTAAAAAAAAGAPSSSSDSDSFAPPVDTFNTEAAYILHVALPGAKKDDIGVNWNPDVGELTISGVVHRPGDEEFLKTMHAAERRVGMFERKVTLPPVGLAEQRRDDVVDGMGITAKLEDGLLVVVVPKVEKGWTEIRKVDIE